MKLFSINKILVNSIVFFATPAGLIILTYGNGLVEVFGVAVHFAEMFLGRVGEFSQMVTGKQTANVQLIGLALGIGLVFASLMYFSILVMKLYEMKQMANFFSFLFGLIACLTYGKFVSKLDLVHGVIYGASAFFIVLVSSIAGNVFSGKLATIIIKSPQFVSMQSKIVGMIGIEEQGTTRKMGRRTR
jgi:hypothetical protein